MIEITLNDLGGLGAHIILAHGKDDGEEIVIGECYRCIGVFIVWERRKNLRPDDIASQYMVSGFHIPPYSGKAKFGKRQFFKVVNLLTEAFSPKALYCCGGKINTKVNQCHYDRSKKFFVYPIKKLFPSTELYIFTPTIDQEYASLYMNDFFEVTCISARHLADK